LLALLLLVLIGAGVLYALSRDDDENDAAATTTTQVRTVSVPDVVGTTSSEATAALTAAGLEPDLVPVPSDQSAGTVVAQDPAAGDEVDEGSRVRLTVAQEPLTTTAATTTAATTGATTTEPAASPPPPATTTESTTTTAPPEPATVPDVVGQELADAAEAFGDEGLKVAVRYVPSGEQFGTVVAQAQDPGTELKRGDTVQINVSPGSEPPPNAKVPGVAGQKQDDARKALERAQFEVLAIELDGGRKEIVSSQTPPGNASVPRGSLVILYVGR
jgi:serine/threonine-protein kinase